MQRLGACAGPFRSQLFATRSFSSSFYLQKNYGNVQNTFRRLLNKTKFLHDKNLLKIRAILHKGAKKRGLVSAIGFGVGTGIYFFTSPNYYCLDKPTNSEEIFQIKFEIGDKEEEKTVWTILWETIKENKWLVLISLLTNILNAIFPFFLPLGLSNFLSKVKNGQHIKELLKPTAILIAVGLGSGLLQMLDYILLSDFIASVHNNLSTYLFQILLKQDITFFDTSETSELVARLDSDINNITSTLKHTISVGLKSVISMIGGAIYLYVLAPKLSLLMFVAFPTMFSIGSLFTFHLRTLSRNARMFHAKVVGIAYESLSLIRTVRFFAREEYEKEKYLQLLSKERGVVKQFNNGIGLLHALTTSGMTAVMSLVLFYGGYLVIGGSLTTDVISQFLFQSFQLQKSITEISKLTGEYSRASGAFKRVNGLLSSSPSIPLNEGITLPAVSGSIMFKDVSFSYPSRPSKTILQKLHLQIPAGSVYAIVGPSGSGKSTFLSLIERFYDVDEGAVYLDGHNVNTLNPSWLRQQIGIVSQEPVLFDTTIMENIRYGLPSATEEQVFEAAKKANCHEFITHFSEKYETRVGERGVQLSGGQKQRIAIARALLLDPKILILDEATSSLDSESEIVVQQALDKLMVDRTVIVVAHRLSTIRDADCIVVLKDGKIIEQGTHEQLISLNDIYAAMINAQNKDL